MWCCVTPLSYKVFGGDIHPEFLHKCSQHFTKVSEAGQHDSIGSVLEGYNRYKDTNVVTPCRSNICICT